MVGLAQRRDTYRLSVGKNSLRAAGLRSKLLGLIADQVLPRPLTPEDDGRIQAELRRRNGLLSHALLLTRLTGMRIGETIELFAVPRGHPLRHLGGTQWILHVPIGKLHNERWTPVDDEVRTVVARLQFLRTCPQRLRRSFSCLVPRAEACCACSCARLFPTRLPKLELPPTSCRTR
jgi:hypothetical protein